MSRRDAALGRATLGLDTLLADPALAPLRERIALLSAQEPDKKGLHAQIDAAIADIAAKQETAVRAGVIAEQHSLMFGDHPGWVRLGVLDTLLTWIADAGSTCMHSPSPLRPQPAYAVAWRPRLVACVQCPHLTKLVKGSVADLTCDGCGRLTEGADTDDPLYVTMVQFGVLTYGFGTCEGCKYWDEMPAAAVTH